MMEGEGVDSLMRCGEKRRPWQPYEAQQMMALAAPRLATKCGG